MTEQQKYWNPEIETVPRKELKELQWRKLRTQLLHVHENSPFYRQKFNKAGIDVTKIDNLEDFERYVPITSKDELRAEMERTGNPVPHLCVPWEKIYYISLGVGTTGSSTYQPMTKVDFEMIEQQVQRLFWQCGARPRMKVHFILPASMSAPYYSGIQKLGVIILQDGPDVRYIERIIEHGMRLKPEFMYMPLLFYSMIEAELGERGTLPKDSLSYQVYINFGDVFNERMREHCEKVFGGRRYSIGGSGADISALCCECPEHNGQHFIIEDMVMVEVIDLKTGRGVESGGRGELVFTDIAREVAPHIRWRTEDLVDVTYEPCTCGRTSMRVRYVGRTTFKVQVKGEDIFPISVEDIIREIPETSTNEFTILKYADNMDWLQVRLGCPFDKVTEEIRGKVEARLTENLGVPTKVEFCEPEEIPRVEHKIRRVTDLTNERSRGS